MASDLTPNAPSSTPDTAATPHGSPHEASTGQAPPTASGALPYPPYPPFAPYPPFPPSPDAGYGPYPYPYVMPGYYPWMYAPPAPRLGTWALVSMICGAVSIASLQTILAILAVVFGFIGLNEIKKSGEQVEGRGFAIAGVVMGFISLAIGLLIIVLYIVYFIVIFSALGTYPG